MTEQIKAVDPVTLKAWLDNDEAILVDVREVDEFNEVHIPGAVHLPLGTCNADTIPVTVDKKLVFQCKRGKRGQSACDVCIGQSDDMIVWNLTGGIDAWIEAGLPVNKAG